MRSLGRVLVIAALAGLVSCTSSDEGETAPTTVGTAAPTTTPATTATTASTGTLLEVSGGNGTHTTDKVNFPKDWDLDWSYDCSQAEGGQGRFQVSVYKEDGRVEQNNPPVNQLGPAGSGVEHYHTGGVLSLSIYSDCTDWTVKARAA